MIDIYDPNFKIDELKEINGKELGKLIREYPEIAPMLPKGLKVEGELDLCGCSSLESLPEGLKVEGGLYLNRCTSLRFLPEGLKVEGYLDLEGCSSLKFLPKGLKVGWNLWLKGCPAKVPPDAQIGGEIH